MAAYTVQMTGTTEVAPAVLAALGQSFGLAAQQNLVDQLSIRQFANGDANKLNFTFGKILDIPAGTPTALLEYEDPASVALAGSTATFSAVEHGLVVTRTSLADVISGGQLSVQAASVVGRSAAQFKNTYAASVLAAGTNTFFAGAGTNAGLAIGDVMTPQLMNRAYNALSKAGATKDADGYFRAILHPDVILDLKNATGAGSWSDVFKYADPTTVMRGEVGRAFGFKVIESTYVAAADQTGAGTVDVYKSIFMGADALGQGVNVEPQLRITSSDKLARFVNYGWYACLVMAIIAQEQVFVVSTSSSVGANAA